MKKCTFLAHILLFASTSVTITSILTVLSFCPSSVTDGYRATPLRAPATIAGVVPRLGTNQQTFPLRLPHACRLNSPSPGPVGRCKVGTTLSAAIAVCWCMRTASPPNEVTWQLKADVSFIPLTFRIATLLSEKCCCTLCPWIDCTIKSA